MVARRVDMGDGDTDDMDALDDRPVIHYKDVFTAVAGGGPKPQGDKMLLPPSALQALLDASAAAQRRPGHSTYSSYTSSSTRPDTDLPQPLTFRLVHTATQRAVFAGIREFSADEGTIVLSAYLRSALGMEEMNKTDKTGGDITVSLQRLPKGTYVQLRPLAAGYNPGDWRPLLERQLREGYTTLTRGAVFSVRNGGEAPFRFRVGGFQPAGEGVCVVDTDLEVDMEAAEAAEGVEGVDGVATAIHSAATPTATSPGGTLDIFKAVAGRVVTGDYVDYELPAWDRSRPLEISLSGLDDDDDDDNDNEPGYAVDLFVSPRSTRQRARPRESEHVWASFDVADAHGAKTITIAPTNVALEGAEAMLVSVHGWRAEGEPSRAHPFTLRARAVLEEENDDGEEKEEQPGTADAQCDNCHQWVPARSMVLHESFCRRNNVACGQCGRVFARRSQAWAQHWHCEQGDGASGSSAGSRAKHEAVFHTAHACEAETCGGGGGGGGVIPPFSSLPALAQHRTTTCPSKLILCQFCHLEVPQEGDAADPVAAAAEAVLTGQTPHERADGARTTECYVCDAIVRMRDVAAHLRHHALDRQRRPPPAVCRDELCGRTQHGVGGRGEIRTADGGEESTDRLGLCAPCFAPLYASTHDPAGRALRRRVERRYLAQLLTGCGRPGCANSWCKTGRVNRHMDPLDADGRGVAALLPLIRPLLAALADPSQPMHFCVDDDNQQRRAVADSLAAAGRYALPWCVAACEAVGPDAAKAWEWLSTWAPEPDGVDGIV